MNEKEITKLFKQEAKKYGYKFKEYFAFKEIDDFFYVIYTFVGRDTPKGNLRIEVLVEFKPMIIDEIFWDITDLKENLKMPLSFRGNGAFTFPPKDIVRMKIYYSDDATEKELIEPIQKNIEKIEKIIQSLKISSLDDFLNYIENHKDKTYEWSDIDLCIGTNIALKKYDTALELCHYAKNNKKSGSSWVFDDKDFYDLAIKYIEKKYGA